MPQQFGDERTIRKLEIIQDYARLFLKILGPQSWAVTHYVDAFAGEGHLFLRGDSELVEGSVARMGKMSFDQFHLVELDEGKCDSLKRVSADMSISARTKIYQKDVNVALPEIVKKFSNSDRSLIFIDPFGMQLKWETLCQIAEVPYCDIVYLFPCHDILRSTPRESDGILHEGMKDLACSCLGMTENEITDEFYSRKPPPQQKVLFTEMQEEQRLVRMTGYQEVENLVRRRLGNLFKYVYEKPYRLEIDRRPPLYTMYLMTSNPSDPAKNAIRRLGQHVFNRDQ